MSRARGEGEGDETGSVAGHVGASPRNDLQRRRDETLMRCLIEELAHEPNPLRRNEITCRISSLWRKHRGQGEEDVDILSA